MAPLFIASSTDAFGGPIYLRDIVGVQKDC